MLVNLKAVVIASVLSCFLYSLSIYFPLFGGFISFFSPLPFGFLRVKENAVSTYLALLITIFILYAISGKIGIVLFLIQYTIPFLLFIEIFLLGISPYNSMLISCVAVIVLFYGVLLSAFGFNIANMEKFLTNYIYKSIEIAFKNYAGSGISKADLLSITENLKRTVKYLVKMLPSIMFIFHSAIMLGNFYILKRSIQKYKEIDLSKWQVPFYIVWLFIFSGFFVILFKNSHFWIIALNILIICSFLFLIQGLCIIEFWFGKYNVTPIMRGIFLFTMFLFQIVFIFIALLGLFDIWFDFRKLNKEETNESNT